MNLLSSSEFSCNAFQDAGYLTTETMKRLRSFFVDKGHRPSQEMWEGLQDLAATMEKMVNGECEH